MFLKNDDEFVAQLLGALRHQAGPGGPSGQIRFRDVDRPGRRACFYILAKPLVTGLVPGGVDDQQRRS